MTRLYSLLAGMIMTWLCVPGYSRDLTPDIANFSFTVDPVTKNVVFVNTSTIGNEPGTRRAHWIFGDGTDQWTGALDGTQHHYNYPGTYTACLKIIRVNANTADSVITADICRTIVIGSLCEAGFETVTVASNSLERYFVAQPASSQGKKPVRICWNFGDNRDTCLQYAVTYTGTYGVHHSYLQPGSYNVCVNILYDGGCEAQLCKTVLVDSPDSCRSDFERITLPNATNTLAASFRALPWHNHNKKPQKICWNFGDNSDTCINYGADFTGPYTVNHTYSQPGQYNVCARIIYDGGCESTKCKPILIPGEVHCEAAIFELTSSNTSLTRTLYAVASSTPPRAVQSICWKFGDSFDTCINGNSATPPNWVTHTYPGPGTYQACVRIVFEGGCVAEKCIGLVIQGEVRICGGYMKDSLTGLRTFKFRAFAIHPPNDPVISYQWSFGDGSTATGIETDHTFASSGEFRVCLIMVTQNGCETKICKTIHVAGANGQAILQLSPNPVVNILHASFLSNHNENVTIRILNSSGVTVQTFTRYASLGINNWDFNLSALVTGTYLFTLQSPNQLASAIFLKQ
jgi:hypothetical protein